MPTIPWWRRFDPLLVVLPLLLILYGLALIHSATCKPDCLRWLPPSSWAVRQAIYAAAGLLAMGVVASLDYRLARSLAYLAYLGSLAMLGLVLFMLTFVVLACSRLLLAQLAKSEGKQT